MKLIPIIIFAALAGCANQNLRPTDATMNVGGSFSGAWAHTVSAEYDLQQAKKLNINPAGVSFLDAGSAEHKAVFDQLTTGMRANADEEKQKTDAIRSLERILGSITYSVGKWCVRVFWVVVGFLALHFVLGFFAPTLAAGIGGIVSKVFHGAGAALSITQKLHG